MKIISLKGMILCCLTFNIAANNLNAQFGESSKQLYTSPKMKEAIVKHKNVALLPFHVTISFKRTPKNFSPEGNKADEEKAAINMQQGMYTYLLRKSNDYSVSFQEVERTNVLLKKAGVFDKLDEILMDSICKILGVDAVIKTNYTYEKTGTEAGAIASLVLFGGGGKTGSGSLTMQIYNGIDGSLLWRFYKEMNESFTSNGNEVMERMMRKVSRNFPYEK